MRVGLRGMLAFSAALLLAASCRNENAQAPQEPAPSVSSVAPQDGVPVLWIGDEPRPATSLYVYNQDVTASTAPYGSEAWIDAFRGYVDQARSLGVTYISFAINLRSSLFSTPTKPVPPASIGDDLDFTQMDELFEYARAQGVYILPKLWVGEAPEWWANENPDALQHSNDDPPAIDITASFHDPAFWDVMDAYVSTIVNRYKGHPALLGWSPCVGVTRENNYGPTYVRQRSDVTGWADFSLFAIGQFQSWLWEKYGHDDGALKAAWGDDMVTAATAMPPTPMISITDTVEIANGAGEVRRSMQDWLEFRVEEKSAEWRHFVDLVKGLDPDHVVAMNPGNSEFVPSRPVAKNGTADGLERTRDANVDMVLVHPRISFDETPGEYNTQSFMLYAFVAQSRRAGKLATFALEDTGDTAYGSNIDSLARIDSLAPMLASAGGGMGWVVESTAPESGLPVWSETELERMALYTGSFDPTSPSWSVAVPVIAILLDPRDEQLEYPLSGFNSRNHDRVSLYANLFGAGMRIDPIGLEEVRSTPEVLSRYKGIVVADLPRLPSDVAWKLSEYAASGGGLFVAGRTGIFDAAGQADATALATMLGLSANPSSGATQCPSWSFDAAGDPLLEGVSGQADSGNPFYLPVPADSTVTWHSLGFRELGHATCAGAPATVVSKGRTVVWFPRIGMLRVGLTSRDAMAVTVFGNWMKSIGAR